MFQQFRPWLSLKLLELWLRNRIVDWWECFKGLNFDLHIGLGVLWLGVLWLAQAFNYLGILVVGFVG